MAAGGLILLNQIFSGGLEPQVVWFAQESPACWELYPASGAGSKPSLPFGSQGIYIYVDGDLLIETMISNDGKQVSEDNYTLSWEGDTATLCLRGEEQADQYYEITYQGGEASYQSYADSIGVAYMDRMGVEIHDPQRDSATYFEIDIMGTQGRAFQIEASLSDIEAGYHIDDGSTEIYDQTWVDLGIEQVEQIKTLLKKFTGYWIVGQHAAVTNGIQLDVEFPDTQNWKVEFDVSTQGKGELASYTMETYLEDGTLYFYDTGEFPKTYQQLLESLRQVVFSAEQEAHKQMSKRIAMFLIKGIDRA